MLDGRNGILLGSAFTLMLAACGGSGDIGAVPADTEPAGGVEQTVPDNEVDPVSEPNTAPDVVEQPTTASLGECGGANPPARCDADPQTFSNYGAAAIITALELLGDSSCCWDFDGDGDADNALGQGMADIGKLDQLNEQLKASLISGTQTILMEVEGIDDATDDDDIAVHVFGGQRVDSSPTSGPEVALDPATIDQGVAPLFTFDDARIADGRLIATHGQMELEASFNGVLLKPVVHDVQVNARIEALQNGLTLRDGQVGGRLELSELHSQINDVASGCDCLGMDAPLIVAGSCGTPDVGACQSEGRETCAALVEVCPVLEIIASNLADVDSNGDDTMDSISLGALFDADPARITGVMR